MKKTYPHIHCKSPPAIERGLNKQNPSLFVESSSGVERSRVRNEISYRVSTFVCVCFKLRLTSIPENNQSTNNEPSGY